MKGKIHTNIKQKRSKVTFKLRTLIALKMYNCGGGEIHSGKTHFNLDKILNI